MTQTFPLTKRQISGLSIPQQGQIGCLIDILLRYKINSTKTKDNTILGFLWRNPTKNEDQNRLSTDNLHSYVYAGTTSLCYRFMYLRFNCKMFI